jgi:hypothetical protein
VPGLEPAGDRQVDVEPGADVVGLEPQLLVERDLADVIGPSAASR